MLSKSDIETNPEYAIYWAKLGINKDRERIIKIIELYKNDPNFTYDNLIHLINNPIGNK